MTRYPLHHVDTPCEKATFGMGCYWAPDSLFGATKGVIRTCVGYAGGTTEDPNNQIGDYTEVIEIHYDPTKINYSDLLDIFWNNHEYRLSVKLKREYMSMIMYHNEEQCQIAKTSKDNQQAKEKNALIATEIIPASTFYPAKSSNQKYRLQGHVDMTQGLGLTPDLLMTSHVAARLNGYLAGCGDLEQFETETEYLGLSEEQIQYVKNYLS
ncbi:peptide methionine sulfoxide reductase-like isoform X2 [Malaya genurostris]|uniref:peptide methionine sulfoxide reductase-like isoform X2 n=1 Tax=Malaya genurostris TaxID=325434 RepID=UPI0026F3E603|nr:peptide methionine sulfoxide reductase-like isoform X2 [Malaya genurostris]XP_058462849.1 peptide methionine sulfoxide reductase-like isoform X2 [Malaya genurostris]XP_058462850.1 peptide methionine sulfoxide reductase-like isoform X2 [Malaya genurostris]